MNEAKHYVTHIIELLRRNGSPEQVQHLDKSSLAFILRHGREFTLGRQQISGPIKQCFKNAAMLAAVDSDYTYCEGYVESIIPIEHAWCIDRDGRAIETTIRNTKHLGGYFGVPIKTAFLKSVLMRKKTFQVFDWMHPETWSDVDPEKIVAMELVA